MKLAKSKSIKKVKTLMTKKEKDKGKSVETAEIDQNSDKEKVLKINKTSFLVKKNNKVCIYDKDPKNKNAKLLAVAKNNNDAWKKALHAIK
jgi:hypothetical protein